MSYNFISTHDFFRVFSHVDILLAFAKDEAQKGNEENRNIFLKLSIITAVTKFQVFVEKILKEYLYLLKSSSKYHKQLPFHLRLNSLKIFTSENILHKELENPDSYTDTKYNEIKKTINRTALLCEDEAIVSQDLQFETKFPLGKTGLNELIKLFRQINGENIFENPPFDINKLNEILGRRHAIIHEDSNPQITESVIEDYSAFLKTVVEYIDNYLFQLHLI